MGRLLLVRQSRKKEQFRLPGLQRDLYNGTGTGWSSEDEKNHFHRPFGILSLLCGALWLVNIFLPRVEPLHSILMVVTLVFCVALLISHLCYTLSRDDKNKK